MHISKSHRINFLLLLIGSFLLNFIQIDVSGQAIFISNILIIIIGLFYIKAILANIGSMQWYFFLFFSIFLSTLFACLRIDDYSLLISLLLPLSMILGALVTFVIIKRANISPNEFTLYIYKFGVFIAVFTLLQFVVFNIFGINISFTEIQHGQVEINRMPAFSFESDVNGKMLGISIIFTLPLYLNNPKAFKGLLIIVIAFILVQTRSAIIAIVVCILFMALLFSLKLLIASKRFKPVKEFARLFKLFGWVSVFSFIALSIFLVIGNTYIIDRFSGMFNIQNTVSSDVSYLYRMTDILLTIENIMDDRFNWVFGQGWASKLFITTFFMGVDIEDPAGSLILFILYYGGLVLVSVFFYYPFKLMLQAIRIYVRYNSYFYMSIFLSICFMLTVSMMGSLWNKCIFWFLLGASTFYIKYFRNYVVASA